MDKYIGFRNWIVLLLLLMLSVFIIFAFAADGSVWSDDIVLAGASAHREDIVLTQIYPIRYSHGMLADLMLIGNPALLAGNIQSALQMNALFPAMSIDTAEFVPVAEALLSINQAIGQDNLFYSMKTQLETFPTQVPAEYAGAVVRVDYSCTFYQTTNLTAANQLGKTISGTYYGMPY